MKNVIFALLLICLLCINWLWGYDFLDLFVYVWQWLGMWFDD